MLDKNTHIAVLMGGWSAEREVSLMSGNGIADALEGKGYKVTRVDMDRNIAQVMAELRPDIVFNALHGTPGEDGRVQGMLDLMHIPYTHSGLATSVIAIDKELTKKLLMPHGIPMPNGKMVRRADLFKADPLPRPYVLKPVNEGSSVGVAIVREQSSYGDPVMADSKGPWQDFEELLAEPFIRGRELTTAIIPDGAGKGSGDRALCVTELCASNDFYDYEAKYTDGKTVHICPADIPKDIEAACMEYALRAHQILGCKGTSRSDFRWDDERGLDGLYLLEVNTQPGMTPLSLVPEQAGYCGIDYASLAELIIADALADFAERNSATIAGEGR